MYSKNSSLALRPSFWRRDLLLLLVLLSLMTSPLLAAEISGFRAKKILKEAEDAATSGDTVKARELYELVAASTLKTPSRRADALYGLLLLESSRPTAELDRELLERTLGQFQKEFAKDSRGEVVATLAAMHRNAGEQETEMAALRARIEAVEAELAQNAESAAGTTKAASKKIEELESRLRRSAAEVESLKADLAKKDEALQKLKKVVVGGGG